MSCCVCSEALAVETRWQRSTPLPAGGSGPAAAPRRDHAACSVGPHEFMLVGGFDGGRELMDLHACSVQRAVTPSGGRANSRSPHWSARGDGVSLICPLPKAIAAGRGA